MKNIIIFIYKLSVLVVRFSIDLNRRVFVMVDPDKRCSKLTMMIVNVSVKL